MNTTLNLVENIFEGGDFYDIFLQGDFNDYDKKSDKWIGEVRFYFNEDCSKITLEHLQIPVDFAKQFVYTLFSKFGGEEINSTTCGKELMQANLPYTFENYELKITFSDFVKKCVIDRYIARLGDIYLDIERIENKEFHEDISYVRRLYSVLHDIQNEILIMNVDFKANLIEYFKKNTLRIITKKDIEQKIIYLVKNEKIQDVKEFLKDYDENYTFFRETPFGNIEILNVDTFINLLHETGDFIENNI